ncbi:polysaccharide deacetylase [Myxococcus stipitatus DSM 14675]|uniref:Polysaccharide deacetylase n=1 Tax=Myxococcus stipitatus (strain DSM 14675 / JCM 12634 / Mx s8) TaxID=1278073 RepID=L7U229_MYXSD|nr:polysaccharide deacetylase family protein [Myxococcus stipitatus]AGC42846.1 polysaccharide deacetylase [Myxococcus stipitatus DSM 14675]
MRESSKKLRGIAALSLILLSLSASAAQPFEQGMVTITLDDGWATQYTKARPQLNSRGIRATYALITQALAQGWGGYMSLSQVQTLVAEGNGIASHSLTHPDLTTLTGPQLVAELSDSRVWLQTQLNLPAVPDFVIPYGRYDAQVLTNIRQHYGSSRTVNPGRNFRDTIVYELRGNDVARTVPVNTVRGWIDRAVEEKSWLILVFHEFLDGTPTRDTQYRTQDFAAILNHIQLRGLRTVTLSQGLALTDGRTEPEPASALAIYTDALESGFADWSWAEHSLEETGIVHQGSASIRFTPDTWSGLLLHHPGVDLSSYQAIELWVHGGTTGGQLVRAVLHDGTDMLGTVSLEEALGGPLVAGEWRKVTLSLDAMGATSGTLRDLYFQDDSGTTQADLYLDDITLIPR